MSDLIDRASEIELQQRELALQNRKTSPKHVVQFCQDCEEPLSPLRQNMGCCRCVECQTRFEKRQKGYRQW